LGGRGARDRITGGTPVSLSPVPSLRLLTLTPSRLLMRLIDMSLSPLYTAKSIYAILSFSSCFDRSAGKMQATIMSTYL
jgi:hypothetical protein